MNTWFILIKCIKKRNKTLTKNILHFQRMIERPENVIGHVAATALIDLSSRADSTL